LFGEGRTTDPWRDYPNFTDGALDAFIKRFPSRSRPCRRERAIKLFSVNEVFGGWKEAERTHFADGGVFRPSLQALMEKKLMKPKTDQFKLNRVRWAYLPSEEIPGNPERSDPLRTHILSAAVECKKCSFIWRATELGDEPGKLLSVIGGTRIICPKCNAVGIVRPN
jgi:hypothetical protein